jgi:hypothetical protein
MLGGWCKFFAVGRELGGQESLGLGEGSGRVAELGEPVDGGFAAEPGHLALGVLAGGDGGEFDGLREGEVSLDEGQGLLIADGFKGLGRRGNALSEEEFDFADEAGVEDSAGAGGDALVEEGARRSETDLEDLVAFKGEGSIYKELGGGAAGEHADFESADGFVEIVRVDAGGGGGVKADEEAVKGTRAARFALRETAAEVVVASWPIGETVQQGFQVEASTAGDDGEVAARGDLGDDGAGG